MNKPRIIFMGTPEFAVPSLEALIENKFDLAAVVTAPDKPQGRGQKLVSSPVKITAEKHRIPVLQPPNLKAEPFLSELRSYGANLQVIVAFRMLPEAVWTMPSLGTFNLHASLLPQYRGAAPINWAIINGELETGVTTFFLKHEIDTGSIILQEKEPIFDADDAGTLYLRLMKKGAAMVVRTVEAIATGTYPTFPQTEALAVKQAPKIFRETCAIEWKQSAVRIRNFVRGLSPYPAAWTILNGKTFKIFKVSPINDKSPAKPGEIDTDNDSYLHLSATDGWIAVDDLQLEGKKRMTIKEFFRGHKL